MAEDYRVSLGIELNDKQLNTVKTTINNLVDKERKINLDIDFNIKNANRLSDVGKEIESIKKSLKELNNVGSVGKGKGKSILSIDSESLKASINTIHKDIQKIQNAFGRVDKNKGTQSLLTTVNKIRVALEGVTKQFEGLNRSLVNLSGKDFNINLDFGLGSTKKDPTQLMRELRVLEKEAREYENYIYKVLNNTNKVDTIASRNVAYDLAHRAGRYDSRSYIRDLDNIMSGTGATSNKIAAYKEYIKVFKELASVAGIPLTSVESKLSESGDFVKLKNEANEAKGAVKELLGGLDETGLKSALGTIEEDLKSIRQAFESLSSIGTIDGLTASFKDLSEVLDKLISNVAIVKQNIDNIGHVSGSVNKSSSGLTDVNNDLKQVSVTAENSAKALQYVREVLSTKNVSSTNIDKVTADLQELGIEISKVTTRTTKNGLNISVKGIDDFGRAVTVVRQFDKEFRGETIAQSFDTSADAAKRWKKDVSDAYQDAKKITQQIGNIEVDLIGAEAKNDVKEIERINNRLDILRKKLADIKGVYGDSFTTRQNNLLQGLEDDIADKKLKVQIEVANKSELNEAEQKFERLKTVTKEISGLKIDAFKFNDQGNIKRAEQQMEGLEKEASELRAELQKKFPTTSLDEIDDIARRGKQSLEQLKAEAAHKIKIDIATDKFENQVSQLHTQLDQLTDVDGSLDKLRASIKQVDDAYDAMTKATDDESLIQAQKRFAAAVEKTNNELKIQAREQRAANNEARLVDSRNALKTDMLNWLKKNSKATKEYKSEIDRLIASLDKLDQAGVNGVRRRFNNIDRDAEFKGLKGLNFLDSMKNKIKEYSVYFGAAEMFMYAEQGLRSMFEQVKLIDSAMTELKKVTNETDAAYDKFLGNAANRAKEIGTTIDGLVSSTADFARLGYGFEDAQGLAEVANIYAVVGDEIEGVEGATESLISTMAAFKDEMNGMSNTDFAMSIIDKFNEIGNNFAISSGGIGEALERSASSLMAANNTIDESIALITAANSVVQDPTAVGKDYADIKSGYIG